MLQDRLNELPHRPAFWKPPPLCVRGWQSHGSTPYTPNRHGHQPSARYRQVDYQVHAEDKVWQYACILSGSNMCFRRVSSQRTLSEVAYRFASAFLLVLASSVGGVAQTGLSPAIDAIVGSADYGGGIPRGSFFTIFGRELAASTAASAGAPLPIVLGGVRVRVYESGAPNAPFAEAPLLYVSPQQINAILPSSVSEGTRLVRVEVDGIQSTPGNILVVTSRFAAFTYGGLGFGPAVLQQYEPSGRFSLNRLLNPARAGQAMVLWGTGLGPLRSGSDRDTPQAEDIRDDVTVYVAGIAVEPFYAGRSPSHPGLDQINFLLPASVPDQCFVPLVVRTGVSESGVLTLSKSSGNSACRSELGLSVAALERLDQGGAVKAAVLSFESGTEEAPGQRAEAWLAEYDAASLAALSIEHLRPYPPEAGACSRRAYSYSRVRTAPPRLPDAYYGLRRIQVGLAIDITAQCAWHLSPSEDWIYRGGVGPDCAASAYSFRGRIGDAVPPAATGTLPPPRPQQTIGGFAVQNSNSVVSALWRLTQTRERDRLVVSASSRFVYGGNIFSGLTDVREFSCAVPVTDEEFRFSGDDANWVFGLPDARSVSLSLAETSDQVTPSDATDPSEKSVDFVLVRIRNGVAVSSSVPPPAGD